MAFSATTLSFLLFFAIAATAATDKNYGFLQSQKPAPKARKEKLSHFKFYWHDIVSGRDPTAVQVAQAATTNTSKSFFGTVVVIDDMLTEGPKASSKLVGRAQGFYASASKDEVGLLMTMNFAFIEGKYNGSTVTVLGRNRVFTDVREMPVVGGSGLFRFAKGYCQARTNWLDMKTGDAIVEYNLFVIHY